MNLVEFIEQQLSNQFFSGGLILGLVAGLAASLRKVPRHLWRWTKSRLIVTVDISDHDQAFYWLQNWLGTQEYTKTRARILTLTTRTSPPGHDAPMKAESGRKRRSNVEVIFSPAPGFHLLRYKGRPVLLQKIRNEAKSTTNYVSYHETVILQSFSRKIVEELILEAQETAFPIEDTRIAVFRAAYHGWRLTQLRLPRSLNSVILSPGLLEDLRGDLEQFMSADAWYAEHGIPYQRGYMLSGPPGNGKTSLVVALASLFDRDIYIMSVAGMTDSAINNQMAELPPHSFLLIEDIDRAFTGRERTGDTGDDLSFSGLLNAIDGVSAPIGRILFMTTNHPESIDPALMRPGRADKHIVLTSATAGMAKRLFLRFFPEMFSGLATGFAEAVGMLPEEKSMAELQELLIKHLKDPSGAIEELRSSSATGQAADHLGLERLD